MLLYMKHGFTKEVGGGPLWAYLPEEQENHDK
jgi:hypothetical protein